MTHDLPAIGAFVRYFDRSNPQRAIPAIVTAVRSAGLCLTVFPPRGGPAWLCQVGHQSAAPAEAEGFWATPDVELPAEAAQ